MGQEDTLAGKKDFRRQMIARRAAQSAAHRAEGSVAAQRALLAEDAWQSAGQVTLYLPMRGELETDLLLAQAWESGKQVLLPRCRTGEAGRMDFVLCHSLADVEAGHFGILEPRGDLPPLAWEGEQRLAPSLVVLPGVAFDARGYRLGFGGGYYDRALAHPALAAACLVGLAYSWQIVEQLPVEAWDCPVHGLCTEEGVVWL